MCRFYPECRQHQRQTKKLKTSRLRRTASWVVVMVTALDVRRIQPQYFFVTVTRRFLTFVLIRTRLSGESLHTPCGGVISCKSMINPNSLNFTLNLKCHSLNISRWTTSGNHFTVHLLHHNRNWFNTYTRSIPWYVSVETEKEKKPNIEMLKIILVFYTFYSNLYFSTWHIIFYSVLPANVAMS